VLEKTSLDWMAEFGARAEDVSARVFPGPTPALLNGPGTGKAAPAERPRVEPVFRDLDAVQPRRVRWLWRHWLAEQTLAILDGDPGLGKSSLTLDLAARMTTGRAMPPLEGNEAGRQPAGVLLLGGEDMLECTVRPRLDVAGADPAHVHSFEAVKQGDAERPPVLPWDLDLIGDAVRGWGVKLIVVDPFLAFLGDEFDSHKDQDVRRCLRPLARLAEQLDVVVLLIRHLNKLNAGSALYRGGGSIGIVGSARTSLICGRSPEDEDLFVVAMNKSNLGPRPAALSYRLRPVEHPKAGPIARVAWEGEVDLRPDEILAQPGGRSAGRATDLEAAKDWLRDVLAGGPVLSKRVEELARKAGHSWRTVTRAKGEVGVKSSKSGSSWEWSLDGKDARDATAGTLDDPFAD
jgi:hypothetical protein